VYDEFGKTSMVRGNRTRRPTDHHAARRAAHRSGAVRIMRSLARIFLHCARACVTDVTTQTIGAYFGMKQCKVGERNCNLAIWVRAARATQRRRAVRLQAGRKCCRRCIAREG
jgi:hypothetical protein